MVWNLIFTAEHIALILTSLTSQQEELNSSDCGWALMVTESDPHVLSCLLWTWLEKLRVSTIKQEVKISVMSFCLGTIQPVSLGRLRLYSYPSDAVQPEKTLIFWISLGIFHTFNWFRTPFWVQRMWTNCVLVQKTGNLSVCSKRWVFVMKSAILTKRIALQCFTYIYF